MIGFDTTGLGFAIPDIATNLGFGIKQGAWLSISYTAGFAAFLLPAGIITDKSGIRLTLIMALLIFVFTSIFSTRCISLEAFTITRLFQGISAAFLNTSAMALLNLLYPVGESKDRAKAFKYWSLFLGLSFALGPILGSMMVTYISWQWIMLINIPLGVLVMIPFIGNPLDKAGGGAFSRISLISTMPATLLLLLITMYQYAERISVLNGRLIINILIILCVMLLVLFHLLSERSFTRLPELKKKTFLTSLLLPVIFSITYWSLFVVLPGYFTVQMEMSSMALTLAMLLLALPLTFVPVFKIQERLRLNATGGFLLLTAGLLLLSSVFAMSSGEHLFISGVALTLLGTGAAILNPVMARIVMDNVAPENSGLAAALTSTLRQSGFAAGVAFFSLLTENGFYSVLHFTESRALLSASAFPLFALAICIGLNKRSQILSRSH